MNYIEKKIIRIALISRIVLHLVLYLSYTFYPTRLYSSHVYSLIAEEKNESTIFEFLILPILFGDSNLFLKIILNGYDLLESFAFFPLFPISIRFLSKILFIENVSYIILLAVIINNVCFIISSLYLYKLYFSFFLFLFNFSKIFF